MTSAVHPHRRGEHQQRFVQEYCKDGSSPQAWGTFYATDPNYGTKRFIPTGVGNMFFKLKDLYD